MCGLVLPHFTPGVIANKIFILFCSVQALRKEDPKNSVRYGRISLSDLFTTYSQKEVNGVSQCT